MQIYIPPALVLGTNTPHGINVLSDFIEEQTGCQPDFQMTGWSATSDIPFGNGFTEGYGIYGSGDGHGDGMCYGRPSGDGYGDGDGYGLIDPYTRFSTGNGYGYSDRYGYQNGDGDGYGDDCSLGGD